MSVSTPVIAMPAAVGKVARGALLGLGAELLYLPTGLVTASILARHLGADGYGQFALIASLVAWLCATTTSMLGRASIKLVREAADWTVVAAPLLWWRLLIGGGVFVTVLIASDALVRMIGVPGTGELLRLLALDVLLFNIARVHREVLTGQERFRDVATMSAVRWMARMIFIVGMTWIVGGILAAVIGSLLATAAELIFARTRVSLPVPRMTPVTGRFWNVAAPLLVFGVGVQLQSRLDLFMLSALRNNAAEVGAFGAAQNLAIPPALLALALVPLVLSSLSGLYHAGDEHGGDHLASLALRSTVWVVPIIGVVAAISQPLILVIFGAQFAAASDVLPPLFAGGVALLFASACAVVLAAANDHATLSWVGLLFVGLAAVGHWYAIPRWGPPGAAYVTMASCVVFGLALLLRIRGSQRKGLLLTAMRAFVVGIAMYFLVNALPTDNLLVLVLVLLLSPVLVAVSMLAFGELTRSERNATWSWMEQAMVHRNDNRNAA